MANNTYWNNIGQDIVQCPTLTNTPNFRQLGIAGIFTLVFITHLNF